MPRQVVFNHPDMKERRRELRRFQTDAENYLWRRLRNKALGGLKFWRQYSVGSYILDFYCPSRRLAIELDGSQHSEKEQINYDAERTAFLEEQSIKVLRFWNNDILKNRQGVLEEILKAAGIPKR